MAERKPKKVAIEFLKQRVDELTLAEKVDLLKTLNESIKSDKTKLESQLQLLNNLN